MLSNSKVDQLGERLKKDTFSSDDLHLLDSYRRTFDGAMADVLERLLTVVGIEPASRPAKSTLSIVDKLKRESIRLSQMQDIAGCRLIVANVYAQDNLAETVMRLFPGALKMDRRSNPSHGYRAIHVIVKPADRAVEIQIRTELQHLWAQLSERCVDRWGSAIKYGGGEKAVREMLDHQSTLVENQETLDSMLVKVQDSGTASNSPAVANAQEYLASIHERLHISLLQLIDKIDDSTQAEQ